MKLGNWVNQYIGNSPIILTSINENWIIEYKSKGEISKTFLRIGEVKEFYFDENQKLNVFIKN